MEGTYLWPPWLSGSYHPRLPLEAPAGVGSSVTVRNWRRFEWAYKVHLKHVARAGPPGQPYICHGLLDIATLLWAKLPNEDGSASDDVFARSLIEMLVDNREQQTGGSGGSLEPPGPLS